MHFARGTLPPSQPLAIASVASSKISEKASPDSLSYLTRHDHVTAKPPTNHPRIIHRQQTTASTNAELNTLCIIKLVVLATLGWVLISMSQNNTTFKNQISISHPTSNYRREQPLETIAPTSTAHYGILSSSERCCFMSRNVNLDAANRS